MTVVDPPAVLLSLFRMRAARFTDDLPTIALAELLDERLIADHTPRPATLDAVHAFLKAVRAGAAPRLPVGPAELAEREGIDLTAALAARRQHTATVPSQRPADLAVFVVGAPRSGSSYLFNLLATLPGAAYLTNTSCWAWPTYGLAVTAKRACPADVLAARDSKRLKVDPAWLLPAEGEDLFARAIPVYRHLRGHTYQLYPATVADPALLHRAVGSHLAHFAASWFLAKSPFNTFRISQLARLFGPACRFIHLHRDGYQAAASIAANRFAYQRAGHRTTPTGAWVAHVQAVLEQADAVPMLHIAYERLAADPAATLHRTADWLELPTPSAAFRPRSVSRPRSSGLRKSTVEDLHRRLAALHGHGQPE